MAKQSDVLKILRELESHTKKLERLELKVIKTEDRTQRIQLMLAGVGIILAVIEIATILLLVK